jgi:hypothetical protein
VMCQSMTQRRPAISDRPIQCRPWTWPNDYLCHRTPGQPYRARHSQRTPTAQPVRQDKDLVVQSLKMRLAG